LILITTMRLGVSLSGAILGATPAVVAAQVHRLGRRAAIGPRLLPAAGADCSWLIVS
jgi:hypothetical protein